LRSRWWGASLTGASLAFVFESSEHDGLTMVVRETAQNSDSREPARCTPRDESSLDESSLSHWTSLLER